MEERVCSRVQEYQTVETESQLVCDETLSVPADMLQEAANR